MRLPYKHRPRRGLLALPASVRDFGLRNAHCGQACALAGSIILGADGSVLMSVEGFAQRFGAHAHAAPRKRANCHVSPTPRNHQELHGTLGLGDVLRVLVAQHGWICATECSRPSTAPLLRRSACLRNSTRSGPARPQKYYARIVSPEPARRSTNRLTGAILYGSDLKRDLNCVPSLRRHTVSWCCTRLPRRMRRRTIRGRC